MLTLRRTAKEPALRETRDLLDTLVDEFLSPFPLAPVAFREGELAVPIDVIEKEDHIEVRADVPGLEEKDLDVSLHDGYLTLKGEKREEKEEKEADYHRIERRYGAFTRTVGLPDYVDTEKATAEYKKGVLTVKLPKKEGAKPRQITVTTKE